MGGGELDRWAHGVLIAATGGTQAPPDWLLRRLDAGLGGVCLFGRNVVDAAGVRGFTDALRAARPDVLVCTDEEGGDVSRLHRATGSPHLGHLALGATGDVAATRATAAAIGAELAAAGIDWDFAPVADVNVVPDSPVIGVRSFGSDPGEVGEHVAAFVTGLAEARIASCAKHFPGHGGTSVDSHSALPRMAIGRQELERLHLPPFRAAVAAGVDSIMLGHLVVDAVDPDLPASLSPAAVRLLREDLGFQALIVTDALEMRAVADAWTIPGAAVQAIRAGVDALCLSGDLHDEVVVQACAAALVQAVREGRLDEHRLAQAAGRVQAMADGRGAARSALGSAVAEQLSPPLTPDAWVRASVVVRGDPALGPGPLDVVVLDATPNMAAGLVPWDPAQALAAGRPGSRVRRVGAGDAAALDLLVAAPGPQPQVVVVRDLNRHAAARAAVGRLVAAHPDAVVVELGVPVRDPGGRAWVCSRGASAASVAEVARLLLETDPS